MSIKTRIRRLENIVQSSIPDREEVNDLDLSILPPDMRAEVTAIMEKVERTPEVNGRPDLSVLTDEELFRMRDINAYIESHTHRATD